MVEALSGDSIHERRLFRVRKTTKWLTLVLSLILTTNSAVVYGAGDASQKFYLTEEVDYEKSIPYVSLHNPAIGPVRLSNGRPRCGYPQ